MQHCARMACYHSYYNLGIVYAMLYCTCEQQHYLVVLSQQAWLCVQIHDHTRDAMPHAVRL
jgi:hypothetical protein